MKTKMSDDSMTCNLQVSSTELFALMTSLGHTLHHLNSQQFEVLALLPKERAEEMYKTLVVLTDRIPEEKLR